jgi:hypothetical protein
VVTVVVVVIVIVEYGRFLIESSIVQVLAWCLATALRLTQATIVMVTYLGLDRDGEEQRAEEKHNSFHGCRDVSIVFICFLVFLNLEE